MELIKGDGNNTEGNAPPSNESDITLSFDELCDHLCTLERILHARILLASSEEPDNSKNFTPGLTEMIQVNLNILKTYHDIMNAECENCNRD